VEVPARITAAWVASLPEEERRAFYDAITEDEARALEYDWRFWARPEQLAPGSDGALPPAHWDGTEGPSDWLVWAYIAGRGTGKTRAGSEFAIEKARTLPGSHGALVAATGDDARKTMLSAGLEHMPGASGILAISPADFYPHYESSKGQGMLTWPNGSVATIYTAEKPARLRGPQHMWAWVDEIAAWTKELDAWNQLLLGLRLGERPQACVTSTPRTVRMLRELLRRKSTVVTRGKTKDNIANLAPVFYREMVEVFGGTRLGRQELDGELLEDVVGALWTITVIDDTRIESFNTQDLERIVTAIDPQGAEGTNETDQPLKPETGIITAGKMICTCKGAPEMHAFVLEDDSGSFEPDAWATRAISRYRTLLGDKILGEKNFGGAMVGATVRTVDENANFEEVVASRGKRIRAEPIAALYAQRKVHHVGTGDEARRFVLLEDQMVSWDGSGPSPNRLDALVWALTDLMLPTEPRSTAAAWADAVDD
jgi:phage terminase large subunit-like protein